jgi:hypothetical protein
MSRELGLDLYASLELVRQTNCRPFKVIGVVQFMVTRTDFFELVERFIKGTKDKVVPYDKMLVFGTYKGVVYNRIILIKYIDQ